jgi:Tfp pilus assembly protein PilV
MNCKRLHDQRGSTLMESLVAIALFGITGAAMERLVVQQLRMENTNVTSTTAITLASKELEDLRGLDYPDIGSRSSTVTVNGLNYTIQTTVVPDSPQANLKSIRASVSWTEPAGLKSYALYGIYTDVTR